MSTAIKKNLINAIIFLVVFLSGLPVFSQIIEAHIKLISPTDSKLRIEGKFLKDSKLIEKNWSFLQTYADAENLGQRIKDLRLFDKEGNEIKYKKFAEGEFVAEAYAGTFSYSVDAEILSDLPANAHISWIGKTHGLLMLNDLFPTFNGEDKSVRVTFDLPSGWKISSNEKEIGTNTFTVNDIEKAVFLVGANWREKEILADRTKIKFTILDKWQFEDDIALAMAEEIIKEYAGLFGEIPFKNVRIILMNFPKEIERNRWRAETRGANITILSSPTFAESSAKQRLHEQLRHEIFHLWIPNSLNLSGDYAWFYEGFAIYQALKTGVWLGQIGFDDYLKTLEQAYFLTKKRSVETSLTDVSKMRWNGDISSVYAKGLIVAFLCDTALLGRSKGNRDLKNIFRKIYKKYGKSNEQRDANRSILNALQEYDELIPIVQSYISGSEKIDWTNYLVTLGIKNLGNDVNAKLKLKSKLSGREKALLKKLGYNRRRNFIRQKVIKN